MRLTVFVLFFCCLIASCKTEDKIFSTENIPAQMFKVDISKDTVFKTAAGCNISIKANSIESNNGIVNLEVKEAITAEQILMSGLGTMSDSGLLQSGGMIYLNAENATLKTPMRITVPTDNKVNGMMLYKGEEKDGNIIWKNPATLTQNIVAGNPERGEQLYKMHCSSCHSANLTKHSTAPLLWNIQDRRDTAWLNKFIYNSPKLIAEGDAYGYHLLFKLWGGGAMTKFETALSDEDLQDIYSFIKKKSAETPEMIYNEWVRESDSVYNELKGSRSSYYEIDVYSFGWTNIDCLTKYDNEANQSSIVAEVNNKDENKLFALFFIPSEKVFYHNYNVAVKGIYDFTSDKNVFIPQNKKAYIVTYRKDGEKVIYGIQSFTTTKNNSIKLKLQTADIATFEKKIKEIAK